MWKRIRAPRAVQREASQWMGAEAQVLADEVQDAPLRGHHPADGEDARQHGDGPRQEEDRGEEAGAAAVGVEDAGEQEGQEELHVDRDPHVDQRVDDGLDVDRVGEQDLVGVAVEGLGDLEVERVDDEGEEEDDQGQREQQPLAGCATAATGCLPPRSRNGRSARGDWPRRGRWPRARGLTLPPLGDDGLHPADGLVGRLVGRPLVHVGPRHRLAPDVLRVDLGVRRVLPVLEDLGGPLEVDAWSRSGRWGSTAPPLPAWPLAKNGSLATSLKAGNQRPLAPLMYSVKRLGSRTNLMNSLPRSGRPCWRSPWG